ncbi:hypothetical protein V6N12_076386 [Hibiscus sabdariffa]|uniref:Uncharacterized protein n=1 Tax=Hibiscus sabdariffa TaxID=183260 RepID=A0ABR2D9N3_9ROSI
MSSILQWSQSDRHSSSLGQSYISPMALTRSGMDFFKCGWSSIFNHEQWVLVGYYMIILGHDSRDFRRQLVNANSYWSSYELSSLAYNLLGRKDLRYNYYYLIVQRR